MSTSILVRLTTALAAALLLTSCAAEDDPVPIFEEPSAAPTPSASPTPEKETRRQFLQRWADAERDMQNTGDTTAYLALGHDCEPCESFADKVTTIYAKGGSISTTGMTVERVKPAEEAGHLVWMHSGPTSYTESSGAAEQELPGGTGTYRVVTEKREGQWHVLFWIPRAQGVDG